MRPVALVTGASRRLGRALAEGAARAGHDVAVHFRSDPEAAARTVAEITRLGARAEAFRADLRAPGAPQGLVGSVLGRFGRLDLLLHSASPWLEKPVDEVTDEPTEGPEVQF
ncbi:MAG TPA: SDR family NAD(P)-dependent oxidoreductase, partial [Thermoanaerobaculia bacterium]|nr:SDR family NAD(P)-dependent oxidoreductase [Thermoanaerobaculia bacterium]